MTNEQLNQAEFELQTKNSSWQFKQDPYQIYSMSGMVQKPAWI